MLMNGPACYGRHSCGIVNVGQFSFLCEPFWGLGCSCEAEVTLPVFDAVSLFDLKEEKEKRTVRKRG